MYKMAAFGRKNEITIPGSPEEGVAWGWEPHETVTIKGKLTVEDVESALESSSSAINNSKNLSSTIETMVVDWHLTDDNHNIIPKTKQSIAKLPSDYFVPIMEAIDKVSKKKAVADPLPLSTSPGEPSLVS